MFRSYVGSVRLVQLGQLTLVNTGYFFFEIHFMNRFCKLSFYMGIDIYIQGQKPKDEAPSF